MQYIESPRAPGLGWTDEAMDWLDWLKGDLGGLRGPVPPPEADTPDAAGVTVLLSEPPMSTL